MAMADWQRRCESCGSWLARDNAAARCSPCQAAGRARIATVPDVPPDFWNDPDLQRALAAREMGKVIRAYRQHRHHGHRGLSQDDVAVWASISQGQLSRLENGPPIVRLDRLIFWAQLLKLPQAHLWFALPDGELSGEPTESGHEGSGLRHSVDADDQLSVEGELSQLQATQRSAAVLTAIGLPAQLGHLLSPGALSNHLRIEHLQLFESAMATLEQRDATNGGGAALDVAVTLHGRVLRWLEDVKPSLSTSVQVLSCELSALVAWLAYDAGKSSLAKQYVNEALASARFTDATNADLRAMNTLCLLLSDRGRPHDALQCAEQAKRLADGQATRRTKALLHVRSARTHAKLGDARGFRQELDIAEDHLQAAEETAGDDPSWVRFLNRAELAAVIGGSHLLLGEPNRAASAYRVAVEASEPSDLRNTLSRTLWLAEALLRQGDVSSASTTALATVADVRALSSARVVRRLHRLRRTIDRYATSVPAAADLAEAYDEAFVA